MPLNCAAWCSAVTNCDENENILQAANFMADEWLLNRLCQLAARRLFELPQHPPKMQSCPQVTSSSDMTSATCDGDPQVCFVVRAHATNLCSMLPAAPTSAGAKGCAPNLCIMP